MWSGFEPNCLHCVEEAFLKHHHRSWQAACPAKGTADLQNCQRQLPKSHYSLRLHVTTKQGVVAEMPHVVLSDCWPHYNPLINSVARWDGMAEWVAPVGNRGRIVLHPLADRKRQENGATHLPWVATRLGEGGILVHEVCRELWLLADKYCTLAPTSPRREVGLVRSNQSAGHANP